MYSINIVAKLKLTSYTLEKHKVKLKLYDTLSHTWHHAVYRSLTWPSRFLHVLPHSNSKSNTGLGTCMLATSIQFISGYF
jgi:hypothetical protein